MLISTLYESERMRLGVGGSLLVMQYRGAPNLEEIKVIERAQVDLLTRHEKISVFNVAEATSSLLKVPDDARQYSAEVTKRHGARVLGSAMAVTAKGPSAVMVRTFLSGFALLAGGELNMRSFSSITEALTWLRGLPGQTPDVKVELTLADLERFLAGAK